MATERQTQRERCVETGLVVGMDDQVFEMTEESKK
jgi:hypothetical protein